MKQNNQQEAVRWLAIEAAAQVLGLQVVTLRRTLERNARKGPAGTIEAKVDGIVGRKFGRQWRVWLGDWSAPTLPTKG